MRFGILGEAAAWHGDGSVIPLHRPKVRALLTLLALDAGRVISSDRLLDGLYVDAPPDRAANALQAQVSRLRRQLGTGAQLVERHGSGYRLAVDPADVDAHDFERRVAEGRAASEANDAARVAEVVGGALSLWRGPALADAPDALFVRDSVARLDELRVESHELLAEADIGRGEPGETVPRLRALVAAHPIRESSWRLLIRALSDAGRRAEALAAFEHARELLVEELGTDPSPALSALHTEILRDEHEPVEPLPRARRPPAQLTRLVGRDDELARLAGMLADARLVTLTGAGGAGKTRLAIEAARRSQFEVLFVELATIEDPADVSSAVSSAVGLRSYGTAEDLVERLTNVLAQRSMLLLLDNCEHVADAAATLCARLTARCPDLRILVTSREPLGVTGETLCPIPALEVPPVGSDADVALQYPVVRLFAERTDSGQPGFKVDASTVEDVVSICRGLDGMPLAIELAAARVRTLPLAEIAARLHDPFALLSRGDRTKDPRHRTLRAVVEWSWDLLDAGERDLACRLSVFSGGATVSAARQVCGLSDTDELLAALTDKSFVEFRDGRYRMLETIRAFAAEQLHETGDDRHWQREHAAYFLQVAEEADGGLRTAEQLTGLGRLDAEYANLRSALHWAAGSDPSLALRLTGALSTYWWMRGLKYEAAAFGRLVAETVGPQPPDELVEEYLLAVFNAATDIADPKTLDDHLDGVNRLTRGWSTPTRRPMLPVLWAWLSGPSPAATDVLRPPTNALLDSDPWGRALHAMSEGLVQVHGGDPRSAETNLARALGRFRELGERWGIFESLLELSNFPSWRGDHDDAIGLVTEAIDLADELGATERVTELLTHRAQYRMQAHDLERAATDAGRAFALARETGAPEAIARSRAALADVCRLRGDLETAGTLIRRAHQECPTGWLRPADERLYVLLVLGRVNLAEGHLDAAARHHLDVVADGDSLIAASALEGLAAVAVSGGDGALGARLLGAAAVVRGEPVTSGPDVEQTTATARRLVGADVVDSEYAAASDGDADDVRARTTQAWWDRSPIAGRID